MLILGECNNLLDNIRLHKDEKPALKRLNIKKIDINLISKSSDIKSRAINIFLEYIF